jgi:hypothetical protein
LKEISIKEFPMDSELIKILSLNIKGISLMENLMALERFLI